MTEFSIIFQGPFSKDSLPNIMHAKQFSRDIILSTWKSSIKPKEKDALENAGIAVLASEDPGSICTYVQKGISKTLNYKRVLKGLHAAAGSCKSRYIIKARLDVKINYENFYKQWIWSKKALATLNITSVCPFRIGSLPFLFHPSDWVVGLKADVSSLLSSRVPCETSYQREEPMYIHDYEWHTRLSAEQLLALTLTGHQDLTTKLINKARISEYTQEELEIHRSVLSSYVNINRRSVEFASTKYRAISTEWYMHQDAKFDDNNYFPARPIQFTAAAAARIRDGFLSRRKNGRKQ